MKRVRRTSASLVFVLIFAPTALCPARDFVPAETHCRIWGRREGGRSARDFVPAETLTAGLRVET